MSIQSKRKRSLIVASTFALFLAAPLSQAFAKPSAMMGQNNFVFGKAKVIGY